MNFTACTLFTMSLLAGCADTPDIEAGWDSEAAANTESGGESTAGSSTPFLDGAIATVDAHPGWANNPSTAGDGHFHFDGQLWYESV